jgi:putative DNA primase/helicase
MAALAGAHQARHAADLARLRGARLVVAHETARGAPWDGAAIKVLTGGDPVIAGDGRAPDFAHAPQFKLFVAGNDKPALRTVDLGIRRRLKLIPFAVTIPEAEVDPHLRRKLAEEAPGILAWMIAGALDWQRGGLAPPPAVTDATADYIAEEDTFGGWLDEWVSAAPASATEATADLFASWESYAIWAKEPASSRKAFGQTMRARGFVPCRIGKDRTKGFKGLSLRRHSEASVMLAAMAGRKVPFEGL